MPRTLAIGLGANIDSPVGPPKSTLITVRPVIERAIKKWVNAFLDESLNNLKIDSNIDFRWSSLYKTKPQGGPKKQPFFINAVLVIRGNRLAKLQPSVTKATDLLNRLFVIEKEFGRDRKTTSIQWGPRSLDLDLLAWGDLHINNSQLILPHPRLIERDFVLIPLAEAIKSKSEPPIKLRAQEEWGKTI